MNINKKFWDAPKTKVYAIGENIENYHPIKPEDLAYMCKSFEQLCEEREIEIKRTHIINELLGDLGEEPEDMPIPLGYEWA
jgi:hypothetical protein